MQFRYFPSLCVVHASFSDSIVFPQSFSEIVTAKAEFCWKRQVLGETQCNKTEGQNKS